MSKTTSTEKYRKTTEYHFFNLDYDLDRKIVNYIDSDDDSSLEGDDYSYIQSSHSLRLPISNLEVQQDRLRREPMNQKITIQPSPLKRGVMTKKHNQPAKIQYSNTIIMNQKT